MLEAAEAELRRLGIDAYADFAHSSDRRSGGIRRRSVPGAGDREPGAEANDRQRPLLTRMGGIALARLGQREAALRELRHSLETARERGAEYDIAATIDVIDVHGDADPELLAERDVILGALKIDAAAEPVDLTLERGEGRQSGDPHTLEPC